MGDLHTVRNENDRIVWDARTLTPNESISQAVARLTGRLITGP